MVRLLAILCGVVSLSGLLGGCRDDPSAPFARPSFASTTIGGGGFDGANNAGVIPGTEWAPHGWEPARDVNAFDVCFAQGFCFAGTTIEPQFSAVGSVGAVLGAAPNPLPNPGSECRDPRDNPDDPNDNLPPVPDCFALLTTANFFRGSPDPVINVRSGLQTCFTLPANTGWVMNFDWALLSRAPATSPSTDAFAVVLVEEASTCFTAPVAPLEAFRISRSELQQGAVPLKEGGCGSLTLGGVPSEYPLCTGWQNSSIDMSAFAGKLVQVWLYVDEGGIDPGVATSFAIDNLKFEETVLVGPVTGPAEPLPVNTVVNASANFTDTEVLPHTASIDWGDGTSSAADVTEPAGSSPGSASGSHSYTTAGIYSVTISVSDGSGSPGKSSFDFVVVFDLTGGVAGCGWIDSPAGAYPRDPTLTGRARFAFLSRYPRGSTVPNGVTFFRFRAGNLRFRSTSYAWLAIVGAKAQYKGVGLINGGGDFGLLVSAIDGQLPGGGGVDKLRIKIWQRRTLRVAYDNQAGAPDGAEPVAPLALGRIVIRNR